MTQPGWPAEFRERGSRRHRNNGQKFRPSSGAALRITPGKGGFDQDRSVGMCFANLAGSPCRENHFRDI